MWLQVPSKSHSIVIIESLHFGCGLICLIVSKRDMIALPGFFTMKALFFRANPLHLQVWPRWPLYRIPLLCLHRTCTRKLQVTMHSANGST